MGRAGKVGDAAVVGVVGVLWYALPDLVTSRRRRALLKAALIAGGGAYAWWREESAVPDAESDAESADVRAGERDAPQGPGPQDSALPTGSVAALVAGGPVLSPAALGLPVGADERFLVQGDRSALRYGAAVAGIVLPVLVESAVHRLGARLASRGVRAPHTRIALVMGPLGAAVTSLAQARRDRL